MHIFIFYFIYLKGEKGEEEGGWRGFMPSCIAIEGGGDEVNAQVCHCYVSVVICCRLVWENQKKNQLRNGWNKLKN